ncbi:NAD(P)-dependent oxidoreductase [Amycolatopsis sp. NBRC 101858]|uniref:SDR family oxidoreductase n=1 Tax=Amycolatopsis sp. NBRC 101858 TaxID=3032200 RepID=UPI0024A5E3AF|nr:SDR family oxidoreductase [Amycolatopsis sp. NBRC 101858]GLY38366.1 NAD(P)-dependent oxidoreductase [Amycolatopsis sp. NBRC 101858]
MTIAVTGAAGALGRLVIDSLLTTQEPRDVVAIVRDADKAADLAARGVEVRVAEYADADALGKALVGLDKVLLISSSEVGRRFAQHRNVIDAAASAGVPYLAYTSMTKATESSSPLAPEHRQTEEYLAASGLAHTVLRNNWYHENYLAQLPAITESGVLTAAAGEGKVAAAARRDFADGAATVLTTDGHERKVYEFTGDTALSYADIADAFGQVIGRAVAYRPVAAADLVAAMVQAGVDEGTAAFVAAIDTSIAEGALDLVDPTLGTLIGRPTTSLVEVLRAV